MVHSTDSPLWLPFATATLSRMLAPDPEPQIDDTLDLSDPEVTDGPPAAETATGGALLDVLQRSAAAKPGAAPPQDVAYAVAQDERENPAQRADPPAPRLARMLWPRLAAAIRFCALFGTADAVARLLQEGTVTLIDKIPSADLKALREALESGALPDDFGVFSRRTPKTSGRIVLLLSPDQDNEGAVGPIAQRMFWKRVEEVLVDQAPIIIVLPDDVSVPPAYATALPEPRPLPSLNRAMLALLLQTLAEDAAPDDAEWPQIAALAVQLPPDAIVTAMTAPALRVALRWPTTAAIIAHFADATRPQLEYAHGDLSALAAMGALEEAARDLVADLIAWRNGTANWSDMTRSLLLYGPPGVGKTYAASVIAEAAGAGFFATSLSQWQSAGHLGDTLREMRRSFKEARAAAPSILFIDEIDSFSTRSEETHRNASYQRQVVNALLEEMNGLANEEGCVLIGATNAVDKLDPAITRPGRFDRLVDVGLPPPSATRNILQRLLHGDLPEPDIDALSLQARGLSPAALDAAVRQARGAARRHRRPLAVADVGAALQPGQPMPDKFIRRIAAHEAGHALACARLGLGTVLALRITASGGQAETDLRQTAGLPEDIDHLLVFQLAGRAAEKLMTGSASGGAGGPETSDLAKATKLAISAEQSFGLHGSLVWRPAVNAALEDPKLRARVEERLRQADARATDLLERESARLLALTDALEKERVLEGETLARLLLEPLDAAISPRSKEATPAPMAPSGWPPPHVSSDGDETAADA
ncbi:MAG: AAA family ATPase [Paracoccaceae bacterium]|nr:AAA family ATPase [Paracoccaceae bacterium]